MTHISAASIDPKYQAESDARTMTDYHKIKADPKRHKAALDCMKMQMAEMKAAMGDGAVKKGEMK